MRKTKKLKHPHRQIRSKWIRRTGVRLAVYANEEGGINCFTGNEENPQVLTDGALLDLFIWLGRYLAEKRKLPRHLNLELIAQGANRTSRELRTLIAMETLEDAQKPSGLEVELTQ